MQHTKQNLRSAIAAAIITVFTFGAILISSCSKSNSSPNFVGTYSATSASTCGGGNFIINAGSGSSSLSIPATVNSGGSCAKSINYIATTSGSTITIAPQTFTDNCSVSVVLSGTGSLSGNTLTLTLTETLSSGTISCTFVGTK